MATPEQIAEKVKRPLKGLKVACYYGCLITRPAQATGAENPEYPMQMDRLLQALGAQAVDWSYKTDCCGGSLSVTQTEQSLNMSEAILKDARDCGAEAVITMQLGGSAEDIRVVWGKVSRELGEGYVHD